jgi:hypothetical protein
MCLEKKGQMAMVEKNSIANHSVSQIEIRKAEERDLPRIIGMLTTKAGGQC